MSDSRGPRGRNRGCDDAAMDDPQAISLDALASLRRADALRVEGVPIVFGIDGSERSTMCGSWTTQHTYISTADLVRGGL
jgi:hypothetical protein